MMKGLPRLGGSADWLPRYFLAVLSVLLAWVGRLAIEPLVGPGRVPFITLFPAIVFCAWYCGLGPSVLAVILSAALAFYSFFPHQYSSGLADAGIQYGAFAAFSVVSAFVIALGESNRRARNDLTNRVHERTSELSAANETLRLLTARLIQSQDEERRRLARELHDSVGQVLAAISMNVTLLQSMNLSPEVAANLADNADLIEEGVRQIRTISHLLHPPLLDEVGLLSALKWYVEGFSQRSKIAVTMRAPEDLGRFDKDMEIAVFRVVQECLTNIHRHSGTTSATVEVTHDRDGLEVAVQDRGTGMGSDGVVGSDHRQGVGLNGMRERIAQLGGDLEVRSGSTGTVVTARLPVPRLSEKRTPSRIDDRVTS